MGDDLGLGVYLQGIMSGKTPNLDKLAAEGFLFAIALLKHSAYLHSWHIPTMYPLDRQTLPAMVIDASPPNPDSAASLSPVIHTRSASLPKRTPPGLASIG
jgi:hypothetical protein